MGVSILKCIIKKDKFLLTLATTLSPVQGNEYVGSSCVDKKKKGNRDGRGKEQNVSEEE